MRAIAVTATLLALSLASATSAAEEDADNIYWESTNWKVIQLDTFCRIVGEVPGKGEIQVSVASLGPIYISYHADVPDGPTSRNVSDWKFDQKTFSATRPTPYIYNLNHFDGTGRWDDSSAAEAAFRQARSLTLTKDGREVFSTSLTGSAAAFRQAQRCAGQFKNERVPVRPPPPPALIDQVPVVPEPDLSGPFESDRTLAPIKPSAWITQRDFLPELLRAGAFGVVGVRLTVSERGRLSDCEVTSSSGFAELDAYTCFLLTERARFQPATDANAKPVAATYRTSVRWQPS